MNRVYTQDIREYIEANYKGCGPKAMAEKLNEHFGTSFSAVQINRYYCNHHLRSGVKGNAYPAKNRLLTPEQDKYLRSNYYGTGPTLMTKMMNDRFGTSLTMQQIKAYASRYKINSGLTGRFVKGQKSWNKGMKWDDFMTPESAERARATCFKPGNVPANTRDIGSESMFAGYPVVKVTDQGTQHERWRFKSHVVWEKHHGPIPEGMEVIFLDGDRFNCDIENLALADKQEKLYMTRFGLRSECPEITKAGLSLSRLSCEVQRRSYDEKRDN